MPIDYMAGKLEKPLPLFFRSFKYRMDDIYRQRAYFKTSSHQHRKTLIRHYVKWRFLS